MTDPVTPNVVPPGSDPASSAAPAAPTDPRWPYAQGPTAPDEAADPKVLNIAQAFIAESKRVRAVQVTVLVLAGLVLAILLLQLSCVVRVGFADHLGKAEDMLVAVAEREKASTAIEASKTSAAAASTFSAHAASAPSSAASAPAEPVGSDVKSLHELLATGLKALTYSTVAVISILVIAISIITIAIAKVVFAMAPHRMSDEPKAVDETKAGKPEPTVVLPTMEFAKEVLKNIGELLKSK